MSLHPISDPAELERHLAAPRVVLGFFGAFSALAERARPAFEVFGASAGVPVLLVDVGVVKGVHGRFGVSTVPAAVTVEDGRVIRRAVGLHEAEGWERALLPHEGAVPAAAGEAAPRHPPVTVYTTPTCVWCTRVKAHLDASAVRYREVDVSRDKAAADALVARSGQMGVPQVEIGAEIIVGFDRARIDRLLGLQPA